MTKQHPKGSETMKKTPFISNAIPTIAQLDENTTEIGFEHWQTRRVLNWLKGIDESVSNYLRLFTQNQLNGSFLNGLTDEHLRRLGVSKESVRRLIIRASNLLSYYTYEIRTENCQKLALKVVFSVQKLLNAVGIANSIINSPTQTSRSLMVLNSVLISVADIHESITRLLFCLDRHPFDDKKEFIHVRDQLARLMKEMIDSINPNNKQFFAVPQLLVRLGQQIEEIAREELIHSNDSCIIETPYIQRTTLYGYGPNDWGIEFRCTAEGILLITSIDTDSLNFSDQKIHVGDEIVEINRQSVIGWKYTNVVKKMASSSRDGVQPSLDITICKRPRESWMNLTLHKLRSLSPNARKKGNDEQKKIIIDFKHKIQPDLTLRHPLKSNTVRRGRSASLSKDRDQSSNEDENVHEPLFSHITLNDKKPLFRRASVWSESPPAISLRSPFDRFHNAESNVWLLLLASWGDVNRNNRYTNRLPLQIEEKNEDMHLESEILEEILLDDANVCIATSAELEALNIQAPTTEDSEWASPAREDIVGCKITIKIQGSSVSNIDSPLNIFQAKISKFLYGNDVEIPNNSMSTSFSDKAETPITPLSKIFQDFTFYTTPPKVQQQFSPTSMSRSVSPHSHTPLSRVMNIVTMKTKLAPLAEPDDTSDLDCDDDTSCDLPKKSISNDDMFGYLQNILEKCARIPVNDLLDKLHEGWIRRQRISDDDVRTNVKRNSQWVKCWMVLTKTNLLIYTDQNSKEADIVFDLKRCSITTEIHLKTSKHNAFEIVWNSGRLCFAPYSVMDSNFWLHWIAEQCSKFGQEKLTHLNPIYVRSVEANSSSSSSNEDDSKKSSRTSHLKPARILSRLSRRSFSRPRYYVNIGNSGNATRSSPLSNIMRSSERGLVN